MTYEMLVAAFDIQDPMTLIAIVTFSGGILAAYFRGKIELEKRFATVVSERKAAIGDLEKCLREDIRSLDKRLSSDLGQTNVKVELFWKMVEQHVPKLLMHPTQPERDLLLRKITDGSICLEEMLRLLALLWDAVHQGEKDELARTAEEKLDGWLATLYIPVLEQKIKTLDPTFSPSVFKTDHYEYREKNAQEKAEERNLLEDSRNCHGERKGPPFS